MSSHKENAKKQAEVMLAFAKGEQVEIRSRSGGSWQETQSPNWNWVDCDYRVSPKPVETVLYFHTAAGIAITESEYNHKGCFQQNYTKHKVLVYPAD